jgi:tyrosinase
MGCRKNLASLSPTERTAFVNAVLQLRTNGEYQKYVTMHQGALGHGHGGPAFFPWHREYLRRFEDELQAIDASVNLPYWDWTVANLNSTGTESLIWRDDFMGGPGDPNNNFALTTGPFAGWGLRRNAFDPFQFPGSGGPIATAMAALDYATFRTIEGPHGGAHVWVGGNVGNAAIAPGDPVFWLIHANVDRLWAEWTVNHQGDPGWIQYQPTTGGPVGHNLNDTMWPWNGTTSPFGLLPWTTSPVSVRPADLLDHRALDTLYDTIDPVCRPRPPKDLLKERLPKEFKELLPKELKERPKEIKDALKERLPKELKERPKELMPKEIKEGPKELSPKEIKERPKELMPKEIKEIREDVFDPLPLEPRPFIDPALRPDLSRSALDFEPDVGR